MASSRDTSAKDFLNQFLSGDAYKSSPFYKYLNPNYDLGSSSETFTPGQRTRNYLESLYGSYQSPLELATQYSEQFGTDLPRRTGNDYFFGVGNRIQSESSAARQAALNQQKLDYYRVNDEVAAELNRLRKSGASAAELEDYRQQADAVKSSWRQPMLAARGYIKDLNMLEGIALRLATDRARVAANPDSEFLKMPGSATARIPAYEKYGSKVYEALSQQSPEDAFLRNSGSPYVTSSATQTIQNAYDSMRDQLAPKGYKNKDFGPGTSGGGNQRQERQGGGLNLGVGGSADTLNRKDILAARESGMSRKEIRQAVKEGDIRMSAKAKAQLFGGKK